MSGYYASMGMSGFSMGVSTPVDDEASQRCGLAFNPSDHEPTSRVKLAATVLMKVVLEEREHRRRDGSSAMSDEYFEEAIKYLGIAQMLAVKALHVK